MKHLSIYLPIYIDIFRIYIIYRIYKTCIILAEGYNNANVHILRVRETDDIFFSMKDVHNDFGVKNIFDLVLKEIYGIYEQGNQKI